MTFSGCMSCIFIFLMGWGLAHVFSIRPSWPVGFFSVFTFYLGVQTCYNNLTRSRGPH